VLEVDRDAGGGARAILLIPPLPPNACRLFGCCWRGRLCAEQGQSCSSHLRRLFGCGCGAGGRAEHVAFRRQARAFVDDKKGDGGRGDETQAMLQALREDRAAIDDLHKMVMDGHGMAHPSHSESSSSWPMPCPIPSPA
jgi:hypothetical protein